VLIAHGRASSSCWFGLSILWPALYFRTRQKRLDCIHPLQITNVIMSLIMHGLTHGPWPDNESVHRAVKET
jgi:hypothetical protein